MTRRLESSEGVSDHSLFRGTSFFDSSGNNQLIVATVGITHSMGDSETDQSSVVRGKTALS